MQQRPIRGGCAKPGGAAEKSRQEGRREGRREGDPRSESRERGAGGAQGPGAAGAGEVELGGGAGRAGRGRRGQAERRGGAFGAPRRRGWRPPVRAGRCVCALARSRRKMAQKGKLG